jgi:hypothetical protein
MGSHPHFLLYRVQIQIFIPWIFVYFSYLQVATWYYYRNFGDQCFLLPHLNLFKCSLKFGMCKFQTIICRLRPLTWPQCKKCLWILNLLTNIFYNWTSTLRINVWNSNKNWWPTNINSNHYFIFIFFHFKDYKNGKLWLNFVTIYEM